MTETTGDGFAVGVLRSRWRRRGRAILVAAALLAGGYATLPWWLPTGWLRARIQGILTKELHRPVSLGSIKLSWGEGVEIEELVVQRRPAFGQGALLRIDRIRCPFSPIGTVLRGTLDFLTLESPQLWVVLNQAGDLNVGDLRFDRVLTPHLKIADCLIHVENQQNGQRVIVGLGDADLQLDRASGKARWRFHGGSLRALAVGSPAAAPALAEEGGLRGHGEMLVPTLNRNVPLDGTINLSWDRLNLTSLGLGVLRSPAFPLRQIGGQSKGAISLQVDRDLEIHWKLKSQITGLKVSLESGRRIALDTASVATQGEWDPSHDQWDVYDWSVATPGLEVSGRLRATPRSRTPVALHVWGKLDVELLRAKLAAWESLPRLLAGASGPVKFNAEWSRSDGRDRFEVALDGSDMSISQDGGLRLPTGQPKTLRFVARQGRRARQWNVQVSEARLGPISGSLQADLPAPSRAALKTGVIDWLARGGVALETKLAATDAESLASAWPRLAHHLRRLGWRGAGQIELRIRPQPHGALILAELHLPEASAVAFGPYLSKPWGRSAAVTLRCRLPAAGTGRIDDLSLSAEIGDARLEIGGDRGGLRWTVLPWSDGSGRSGILCRQVGDLEVRLDRLEQWLKYSPRLAEIMGDARLAGRVDLELQTRLKWRSAEGNLKDWSLSVDGRLDGRELDVWVPSQRRPAAAALDWFAKAAGQHGVITFRYRFGSWDGQPDHRLAFSAELPGMQAHCWWRPDAVVGDEWCRIDLSVRDVRSALAQWPILERGLLPYHLRGGFKDHVRLRRVDRGYEFSVNADLTELAGQWRHGTVWAKPAGMVCKIGGDGAVRSARSGEDSYALDLRDWKLSLAGGQVNIENAALRFPGDGRVAADLDLGGEVRFDEELQRLSPALAAWLRRHEVNGRAGFNVRLDGRRGRWRCRGSAELTDLGFRVWLGGDKPRPEPLRVKKGIGMPATGRFDLMLGTNWPGRGPLSCSVADLRLKVGSAQLIGHGSVALNKVLPAPELRRATAGIRLKLPNLRQSGSLVSHPLLPQMVGGLQTESSIRFDGSRWQVGPSWAAFDGLTADLAGSRFYLDGAIEFSGLAADTRRLVVRLDDSDLLLAGHITGLATGRFCGDLLVGSENLDFDHAAAWTAKVAHTYFGYAERGAGSHNGRPDEQGSQLVQRPRELLRRCQLTGTLDLGRVHFSIPETDEYYDLDRVRSRFRAERGAVESSFLCAMSGGVASGACKAVFNVEQPYFDLELEARDLAPDQAVQDWIASWFPGMTVTGLTSKTQHTRTLIGGPADQRWPAGQAELIINGGYIVGRSAPVWMTKVLPGLGKTQYRFSKMRNRSRLLPDGKQYNDMVFIGKPINLYMTGTSTMDGQTEYEVGWIGPFAMMDSRYWHEKGLGRVPVFTSRALIKNRKFQDQTIRYVPLHRLLYAVVGKTLAVPVYGVQRLVQGPEGPDSSPSERNP